MTKMNLVLLGAPGAGKGTHSERLIKAYHIPQISTGDILRAAVREGTPLGLKAKNFMDNGQLVPDELIIGLVGDRTAQKDCENGFILDGFPRTVAQAQALDELLDKRGSPLSAVVNLQVPEEELMTRICCRRSCTKCGAVYNTKLNPSKSGTNCDKCGAGPRVQRADDNEETIAKRLHTFHSQTEPVVAYYRTRSAALVHDVDASGNRPDEVFVGIKAKLDAAVRPTRIVLLGPPGAGKGTAASGIVAEFHVPQISTGDMLRAAVAAGTPTGLEAKSYMDSGKLVPDATIVAVVMERITQPDCARGFILDGFPRTVPQAEALDAALHKTGSGLTAVLSFEVKDDDLVARLCGRRSCEKCGQPYHVKNMPSKVEGVCDKCGGKLIQRADDNETTIRKRLETFHAQTEPVAAYYSRTAGLLVHLDGSRKPAEVQTEVIAALKKAC